MLESIMVFIGVFQWSSQKVVVDFTLLNSRFSKDSLEKGKSCNIINLERCSVEKMGLLRRFAPRNDNTCSFAVIASPDAPSGRGNLRVLHLVFNKALERLNDHLERMRSASP